MDPSVPENRDPQHLNIAVLAHLHHPIASPYAGGLESHTALLVETLAGRGHQVTLFAREGSRTPVALQPVLERDFRGRGYPDDVAKDAQHARLDGALRLALATVRSGDFDAVVNNSLSPIPHGEPAGIPTLHVFHTPVLPRIAAVLSHPMWQPDPSHAYATVSASNARGWRPLVPDLHIVHNGIPLERWRPRSGDRNRSGMAAWSGRITPEKGTHMAIAAARLAGMDLQIAGPVQGQAYFDAMVLPELDAPITYLGHLDHALLRRMVLSAEVFISSPLWEEPFGLTAVEAMACGTPVAALPGGAMAELVAPEAGVLAEGADSESLAAAMGTARRLPRDTVLAAARRFDIETMVDGYEGLLASLVLRRNLDPMGEPVP
jgi:glycosyltransferase involved in cell wall biosynthesis